MSSDAILSRRRFHSILGAAAAAATPRAWAEGRSPGIILSAPEITHGICAGDVREGQAVIWSRSDRPARMIVEWDTSDSFRNSRRIENQLAVPENDFTAKTALSQLPADQTIFYRVRFRDLDSAKISGRSEIGRFKTPASEPRSIRFVWGGDVAGQGWGIDPSRGGMAIFQSMRKETPDFFVHSGDHIYADNPIFPEARLDDSSVWKNLVTEEVSKVAETIEEFRGRYRYNLTDANYRRFLAEVPIVAQWDDHEVTNNWYPGEILADDPRYKVKDVDLLAKRGKKAFLEYLPLASDENSDRIQRKLAYGPLLDLFVVDERTYRGPNTANRQPKSNPESAFLGSNQLDQLKRDLKSSRATWKVIASDMPVGLVVRDGKDQFEAVANGDSGPPLGRELEIADLLRFIKREEIRNVVWITADVHYAAAHHYDPSRARFQEFSPFWEFVAGPLHAGTFGPSELDATFGPEVRFSSIPQGMKPNRPPSEGLQFYGVVDIAKDSKALTVTLKERSGRSIYSIEIAAT